MWGLFTTPKRTSNSSIISHHEVTTKWFQGEKFDEVCPEMVDFAIFAESLQSPELIAKQSIVAE